MAGRTRAKVCGLTNADDVAAAVDAGADALGFIVDVPVDTPREIDPETAATLVADVPPFVSTVLVTMAAPEDVPALHERVGTDAVQVHGDVDADALAALAADCDATLVKTVDAAAPESARAYADVADALLVDSTDASGAGGTGRTHDWTATRDLAADLDVPVVLAGGLTPANVAEAVRTVEPYAVDVASGVEREGGAKDRDAVRSFVANATGALDGVDEEAEVSA
ncbi:phosphoribosylanthranilate isomerase [Halarchaeum rubridurum]|uniref:N-(5'-phosphoribosyl)anthranilate isomerase n=1 Tax=Halarchaeum rubridurum TaxID=489911 RepID=A0A830FJ85_9EURY|nr:phosphoribosylanthranilate isomerase [Halarchaeum rubridurum]MBP1953934.1 phosphoribosylanthranilate isomerase [Halarchaeum rubridurum]GGM55973.1 N-(5'-phosphoribosyl)anthranilate isomerase [Halarchaeum rubridurum]